jgi:hypothetical protein
MKKLFFSICFTFLGVCTLLNAQILTKEDSLNAGLVRSSNPTVLSGYGNVRYNNNLTNKEALLNVDRIVLFVGHRFTKKIAFFSELEIEDCKIAGGETGGEFAMEQAFLKFDINSNNYITTGLFIPRIGIINENHLPTTFNGNERPFVENFVIPATWREIGVGYYGTSNRIQGLNYSASIMNGLDASKFEKGDGFRGGRYEGRNANANALAVNGALLYYRGGLRYQISGYYGGSTGISKFASDTTGLKNGTFSNAVSVLESNIQYRLHGFTFKALAAYVHFNNAFGINAAYKNDTPESIFGAYGEIGYNVLHKTEKNLTLFARYENMNMNMKLPSNVVRDESINRQYLISGITFQPHKGVSIKFDYYCLLTGAVNSTPAKPVFLKQNIINLGVGYSF